MDNSNSSSRIIIIGAGPAGLGVAYELAKKGRTCEVFDKNTQVGGLARTEIHNGYNFDVGPHRFFTKNDEIQSVWKEVLGSDFIKVKRLTRIYYRGKFFNYPIKAMNALLGLGFWNSGLVLLSYIKGKIQFAKHEPKSFEEWMVKNFGYKLYSIFFKTYTEKVWGIPCGELGPEWAGQRIKNLNLLEAIKNAILPGKSKAKSLVEEFEYPVHGAGMMYEKMREFAEQAGSKINSGSKIVKIHHSGKTITAIDVEDGGEACKVEVDYLFSSQPITDFIKMLEPAVPPEIRAAADKLYFRDHITVNLVVKNKNLFPDQWIYMHDPRVQMARIANYNNFSGKMSPDPDFAPISVEYFTFADREKLWGMADADLIRLAVGELSMIGLLKPEDIKDGFVVREKDSYPTYYSGYQESFDLLKDYLSGFDNLQLIGRAGMYKYNNQDHALLTGILAARNLLGEKNDIWSVNADDEYLEVKKKN